MCSVTYNVKIFILRNRWVSYLLLLFSVVMISCKNAKNNESKSNQIVSSSDVLSQKENCIIFPFPDIPMALTETEARKSYLLIHYWDGFDFKDTILVNNRDVAEQGFVNFVDLLANTTTKEDLIRKSLGNWCKRFISFEYASQKFIEMADGYLYNPNSPFYNEYLYAMYLEALIKEFPKEDPRVSRFNFILNLVRRNAPGNPATDFTYYLPDGSRHTLADTHVKKNRLLLMFYDPECESCHDTLLRMVSDVGLRNAVQTGNVSVLAIYTEGNEETWRETLSDMPEGWIVGTDREAVKDGALYDLKAMPSLYLLDGQKKVLLKDASFETISQFIGF